VEVAAVLAMLEEASIQADVRPALALLAAPELPVDQSELRPAIRRSMLLLAAGGDPHRGLELDGRAVTGLADELARPERVAAVERGVAAVRLEATGMPNVTAALDELIAEPGLAWRAYACALLADELGG
jgi:hypothetical protein